MKHLQGSSPHSAKVNPSDGPEPPFPLFDAGPPHPASGLYVHVPFCRDRCTYCAFATVPENPDRHEDLVKALLQEMGRAGPIPEVSTVYLGGGTPALLKPAHLGRLLQQIRAMTPRTLVEITLEANPANVTQDALSSWSDLGINRLSVGVQSFQDDILKWLARRHDADSSRRALGLITSHWTSSWSADLLVGWRGQTETDVSRETRELLAFSPPHVSIYSLTVEPGTALHREQSMGFNVTLADDEVHFFDTLIASRLAEFGLERYEVSNFSRSGHRSVHNSAYWRNLDYLGIGPGASSSAHPFRWTNLAQPDRYQARLHGGLSVRQSCEQVSPFNRLLESLAVGLRTQDGLSTEALATRFGPGAIPGIRRVLESYVDAGLIEETPTVLRIPVKHLPKADRIITELVRSLSANNVPR